MGLIWPFGHIYGSRLGIANKFALRLGIANKFALLSASAYICKFEMQNYKL